MREPVKKEIDLEEYVVTIDYDGNGGIMVMVLDELGDEIEHIEVSNE